jgi:hypothetical protein
MDGVWLLPWLVPRWLETWLADQVISTKRACYKHALLLTHQVSNLTQNQI